MMDKTQLSIDWSKNLTRNNVPTGSFFVRGKHTINNDKIYLALAGKDRSGRFKHLILPINKSTDLQKEYTVDTLYSYDAVYLVTNIELYTKVYTLEI
jgi:hypothetical protein